MIIICAWFNYRHTWHQNIRSGLWPLYVFVVWYNLNRTRLDISTQLQSSVSANHENHLRNNTVWISTFIILLLETSYIEECKLLHPLPEGIMERDEPSGTFVKSGTLLSHFFFILIPSRRLQKKSLTLYIQTQTLIIGVWYLYSK